MSVLTILSALARRLVLKPPMPSQERDKSVADRAPIDSRIVLIESFTAPGTMYEVDIIQLRCSCSHWVLDLSSLHRGRPYRLCRHLVRALAREGVPQHLEKYTKQILWFAEAGTGYTTMKFQEQLGRRPPWWKERTKTPRAEKVGDDTEYLHD